MATRLIALCFILTSIALLGEGSSHHLGKRRERHARQNIIAPESFLAPTRGPDKNQQQQQQDTAEMETETREMLRGEQGSRDYGGAFMSSVIGRPGLAAIGVSPPNHRIIENPRVVVFAHSGGLPLGFAPPTKWRMRPTSTKLTILYFVYTVTITFVLGFIMWLAYIKIPHLVDSESTRSYKPTTCPSSSPALPITPGLMFWDRVKFKGGGGEPKAATYSVATCRCHARRDVLVL